MPILRKLLVIVAACCGVLSASAHAQEPVAELQAFLTSRDCDAGPADGAWGRRTAAAAEAFTAVSGVAIERPITDELMTALASTTARCVKPSTLSHFIPADVLAKLTGLSPKERAKLCAPQSQTLADFMSKKPVDKLEGLTSSMNNSFDLPAFVTLNTFSGEMSELVAEAYVTNDDQLKTDLIKKLAEWANADAYLATRDCTNGHCPQEWQTKRGTKLAPVKDSDSVLERILPVAFAYYVLLADYEPDTLAAEHAAIDKWLKQFGKRLRNHSTHPEIFFGFGVGWQWVNLMYDLERKGDRAFQARLRRVKAGLDRLVLPDGSLKDRTTRGSKATWYHFASLNEVMVTLEILKANGVDLYPEYEARLRKSAKIFLDAIDDPASIYPWAKTDLRSPGDPRKQDFDPTALKVADNGPSWFYIYQYRFPDDENSRRIRKLLKPMGPTAHRRDMAIGIGLSCFYRAAMAANSGAE